MYRTILNLYYLSQYVMTDDERSFDEVESSERRTFLGMAGATAAITLPSGVAGATSSEKQTTVTISTRRSRNNPLSLDRANSIRRQAVNRYRDKSGSQDAIGYSQTKSTEDINVYSLTVHINERGYPVSHLGVGSSAVSQETVQELHDEADEFEDSAKENIASVTQIGGTDDNASSTAPSGLSTDWRLSGSTEITAAFGEYGFLRTATDLGTYAFDPRRGEKGYHFGAFTSHTNTPGVSVSNSKYRQDIGRITHDYSDYKNNMDMSTHRPEGNKSGDIDFDASIGVGLTGPTLTVGASHEDRKIKRTDLSNRGDDYFSWQWHFNNNPLWDGPTKNEDTFELSSFAFTREQPSQEEQILSVNSIAQWYDPFGGDRSSQKSIEEVYYYNK